MSTTHKILVADDSLTIRKLVESVLCEEGYEVAIATTGAECLEQAAAKKPDLILLDYILPDMQGTDVCRSLINSPETWEIPILMMSSNGNAIRQLYQDLNNVADYLTKPFAPNVLKAVVGHLLQKEKPAESNATSNGGETTLPAPTPAPTPVVAAAPEGTLPQDLMDKVTRLIGLMESQPTTDDVAQRAAKAASSDATVPDAAAAPRPKARRARKPIATAPTPEALLRKFKLALKKHLRVRMLLIPSWESGRGGQEPAEFYSDRVLAKDVLSELSADLVRATGASPQGNGALRCPVTLLPLDSVMNFLHANHSTGELRIEMGEETVLACLDQGQVVLLTSNHPRNYCAGASCNFQAVPHLVISEAVRAQEEQSVPFFTSLKDAGQLPAQSSLEDLLRSQGEQCLIRAFKDPHAVVSFLPTTKLSALARACTLNFSLNQLLLTCYRTVNDWFAVETVIPDMDATLIHSFELTSHIRDLSLNSEEARVLTAVRPGRTIPELAEVLQQKPFEICLVLFRLVKLGLVRPGPRRTHDSRVDEEIPVSTPTAEPAMTPEPAPVDQNQNNNGCPSAEPVSQAASSDLAEPTSLKPTVDTTPISEPAEMLEPAGAPVTVVVTAPVVTAAPEPVEMPEPITTAEPVTSGEPVASVEPVTGFNPVVSVELAVRAESITSVEPITSLEPVASVEPNTTVEPAASVEPATSSDSPAALERAEVGTSDSQPPTVSAVPR